MTYRGTTYTHAIFFILITLYIALGWFLLWHVPYTFPFGGPDEPMHLSMAEFIAKHLSWPQWDDKEVVRNAYGVSYSTGGSLVYWLHGLSYRLFGIHRIGAFILLLGYLLLSIIAYKKNILAGFFLLAGLLPQTLFVFTYVNSDSGTVLSALLFGLSVGVFVTGESRLKYLFAFFFFAGFAVTARQHLWAIAFLTFVWAIVYKRKTILAYDKKYWLYALLLALLPASWWFVTSYLANAGDVLGVFTNARSIARFGDPTLPSLARAWSDISLVDFLNSTLMSLYGSWGWTSIPLKPYEYISAAVVIVAVILFVYRTIDRPLFFFFVLLVAANFGFMLIYSVSYDYQPQGRYLFPSIYLTLGMITAIVIQKKLFSKPLLVLLMLLSVQNAYFSTKLTLYGYMESFWETPVARTTLPEEPYTFGLHHLDRLKVVDGKLFLKGWAFDRQTLQPFSNIKLILKKGKKIYEIPLEKRERPDVAAAFKNPALNMAGIGAAMINVRHLPKGTYEVMLLGTDHGQQKRMPLKKKLKL